GANASTVKKRKNNKIGDFDINLYNQLPASKVKELIDEITNIEALYFPFATSFLFRSLIEVTMDEYLRRNLSTVHPSFPNYFIDSNNKVVSKFEHPRNQSTTIKDIPIRKKIDDFKKHFTNLNLYDKRSLNDLDKLALFIDDLNLSIHWGDKRVSYDALKTHWINSNFFLRFLCEGIK
ncbi:hypothetical protein CON07_27410, partial [Bacillus sp. AFS094611]|uniref:hypothetical protein n=1 Tax=Bacillus sp. AFS094611 TaxID=2033516 RepID=UPI000BED5622